MSTSPLRPWVAAVKGGTVLCAHCTCMARLGEACLHIAALLFAAEAHTKLNKDISCTSKACSWLSPAMQNVRYAPISDINFSAPDTIEDHYSHQQHKWLSHHRKKRWPSFIVIYPALIRSLEFFSIVPDFSDMFKVEHETLSKPLSLLYNEQCLNMSYTDLLKVCETVFENITITKEQARNVELAT